MAKKIVRQKLARAPRTKSQPAPLAEAPERTPAPDLIDKVQALRALVAIDRLLTSGNYHLAQFPSVTASKAFIKDLYQELLNESRAHADADLIEDFKKMDAQGNLLPEFQNE